MYARYRWTTAAASSFPPDLLRSEEVPTGGDALVEDLRLIVAIGGLVNVRKRLAKLTIEPRTTIPSSIAIATKTDT